MGNKIDIVGLKFGRLSVLAYAGSVNKKRTFHCRCDCGTEKTITGAAMLRGATTSCGCWRSEVSSDYQKSVKWGKYATRSEFKDKWRVDPTIVHRPEALDKAEYMNEWRASNKNKIHSAYLKRNYGMSREQWLDLVEIHAGACSICDDNFDERYKWKQANIDHCHDTGDTRSLLCNRCNVTLGKVRDRPDLLLAMASYLHKHKSVQVHNASA